MFKALVMRCRIPPWEAGRLTLTYALHLLGGDDGDDAHRGNVPVESLDQFKKMLGVE